MRMGRGAKIWRGRSAYKLRTGLLVFVLTLLMLASQAGVQSQGGAESQAGLQSQGGADGASDELHGTVTAKVEQADGVERVAFDTVSGVVYVNLPDDLAASDTISGTVAAAPKGEQKTEQLAQNEDTISGYVVEVQQTKKCEEPMVKAVPGQAPLKVAPPVKVTAQPPAVKAPKSSALTPFTCVIPSAVQTVMVCLKAPNGQIICRQPIACKPQSVTNTTQKAGACSFPKSATCTGRMKLPGPCDGRFVTSGVFITGKSCPMIAESPRQQICQVPANISGNLPIKRCEGATVCSGIINVIPAPITAKANPVATSTTGKKVYRRKPRTVTQETVQDIRDPNMRTTVTVSGNTVIFTGPVGMREGKFTTSFEVPEPPETVSTGDQFDLTLSANGEVLGTGIRTWQWSFARPVTPMKTISVGGVGTGNSGSVTVKVEVIDFARESEKLAKEHPELSARIQEGLNATPYLGASMGANDKKVELRWEYERIK